MSNDLDRVRVEFLLEAQEIVENVSRDLLELDHQVRRLGAASDPETINAVFRGLHTLKGIAGMFGFAELAESAHRMEDLLDRIRLGRIPIHVETLDLLFAGVEQLNQLLAVARGEREPIDIVPLLVRIENLLQSAREPAKPAIELGADILSALTEFEEHRLRQAMEQKKRVFLISRSFQFDSLDRDLDALKVLLKPLLEIITYLPSSDAVEDGLRLDLLAAGDATLESVQDLVGITVSVAEVSRSGMTAATEAKEKIVPVEQPHPAGHEPESSALRGVRTLRVDIERLDHLMNIVGELGNVRGALSRTLESILPAFTSRTAAAELVRIQRAFERQLLSLQEGLLNARMVPLSHTFDRIARVVRQVARDTQKNVSLTVTGAATEIDKLLVEELAEPLLHLVRNAIDHGLEAADERALAGKPQTGTLALNAYTKGSRVVIEVEDDGRGIDREKVRSRAVARGLLDANAATTLHDDEVRSLLFLPGFSTREEVSDLSGRGVGLDVVKNNIARLGGVVDIESEVGVYTKFRLTLPITLAIMPALILRVGAERFALPMNVIQEALPVLPDGEIWVQNRRFVAVRGQTLPLVFLRELFQLADPADVRAEPNGTSRRKYNVVIEMGRRRLGIVVDEILSQEDIIIKPLGATLRGVSGFSGAADLGQGGLVLVLDASAILDEALRVDVELGAA